MSRQNILSLLLEVKDLYDFPYELKEQQLASLVSLFSRQNCITVLPTGFGKSDIFALFPLLLNFMVPDKDRHKALVIRPSPLRSLIADQVKTFRDKGMTCCAKTALSDMEEHMKESNVHFLCLL